MRIVVGTAVLAAIVSLDGDGSTTFMITVSAMYPLYKRLKMSLVVMTGVAATANGVMNTLPWGGPTARAATALKLDAGDIFVPMIPALAVGLVAVFVLSYVLGLRERKRLGVLTPRRRPGGGEAAESRSPRPRRCWSAPVPRPPAARVSARCARPPTTGGAGSGTDAPTATTTPRRTTAASRASTRTAPPCAPSSTGSTPLLTVDAAHLP